MGRPSSVCSLSSERLAPPPPSFSVRLGRRASVQSATTTRTKPRGAKTHYQLKRLSQDHTPSFPKAGARFDLEGQPVQESSFWYGKASSNTLVEVRVMSGERTPKRPASRLLLHPHRLSHISTLSGCKWWPRDADTNAPLAAIDTDSEGAEMEERLEQQEEVSDENRSSPRHSVCSHRTFDSLPNNTSSTAGRPSSILSHPSAPPSPAAPARPSSIASFRQMLRMNRRPRTAPDGERRRSLGLPSVLNYTARRSSDDKQGRTSLPRARMSVSPEEAAQGEAKPPHHHMYPQLPGVIRPATPAPSLAPEDFLLPLPLLRSPFAASHSSLSSIYSQDSEASITLELTHEQHQQQAPTVGPIHARIDLPPRPNAPRARPLAHCLKRVASAHWLQAAGHRYHALKSSSHTLPGLFKKHAIPPPRPLKPTSTNRVSVAASASLRKASFARLRRPF